MIISNKNRNRRRLLKAIAGAGGVFTVGRMLPETWTRPVVDAVSLPAHAQTSGVFFDSQLIPSLEIGDAAPEGGGILDLIIPTAHAQVSAEAHICVVPHGDEAQLDLVLLNLLTPPGAGVHFSGMVPIGGPVTTLDFVEAGDGCKFISVEWTARLDSLAAGTIFADSFEYQFDFDLPQQECNLPGLGACFFEDDDDIQKPGP